MGWEGMEWEQARSTPCNKAYYFRKFHFISAHVECGKFAHGEWLGGWLSCSSPTCIRQPHTLSWGCNPRKEGCTHLFPVCTEMPSWVPGYTLTRLCLTQRDPFSHTHEGATWANGICGCTAGSSPLAHTSVTVYPPPFPALLWTPAAGPFKHVFLAFWLIGFGQ